MQHGADRQNRGHADHQRVSEHDRRTGGARHRVVALLQDLGDGEYLEFQQGLGEEQVQRDDAAAQCRAQPESGNAMHVTQTDRADGGRAAEDGRCHGAHVQRWSQIAPGNQIVFVGLGLAHAVVAENQHRSGINEYDE